MKERPIDSASAQGAGPAGPPSDLELMLWMDGELDRHRANEIEAFVASDARARAVVASLRLGSELVCTEAEPVIERNVATTLADDVIDAAQVEASRRWTTPIRRAPAWRAPAVAALVSAFAVAAAFAVVIRSFSRAKLPLAGGEATGTLVMPAAEQGGDGQVDAAVSVVDFGDRPGAVVYLPTEDQAPTLVVWLSDDETPSPNGGTP
jgi:anti-sigma factor RsiW